MDIREEGNMSGPPAEKMPEGVVIQTLPPELLAIIEERKKNLPKEEKKAVVLPKRESPPPMRIEVPRVPIVPIEQAQIIDMTTPEFQAGLKKAKAELAAKTLISAARDFDELYANLVRAGNMVQTIKSSLGNFQASEIILLAMKVRAGEARLDVLTDTYGIRTKVRELLAADALLRAKGGRP